MFARIVVGFVFRLAADKVKFEQVVTAAVLQAPADRAACVDAAVVHFKRNRTTDGHIHDEWPDGARGLTGVGVRPPGLASGIDVAAADEETGVARIGRRRQTPDRESVAAIRSVRPAAVIVSNIRLIVGTKRLTYSHLCIKCDDTRNTFAGKRARRIGRHGKCGKIAVSVGRIRAFR